MGKQTIFQIILLLFGIISVHCYFTIDNVDEEKLINDSLSLILKYLNDDVDSKFDYGSVKFLQKQLKGDILEVDLDVSVSCKTPNIEQCKYDHAECKGTLYASPKSGIQVVSVNCKPYLDEKIKTMNNLGGVHEVNVNATGVDGLVKTIIQHVESEKNRKFKLVEVSRVQHQVIYGFNTFVNLIIAPINCDTDTTECENEINENPLYCYVKFYKKPGLHKPNVIKSNNCTESQEFIPTTLEFNDIERINLQKSECNENDMLRDLMSQLIPNKKEKSVESSSIHNLVDENGQPVVISSTFQEVVATEDEPISIGTEYGFVPNISNNPVDAITKNNDEVTPQNMHYLDNPNMEQNAQNRRKRDLKGGKKAMNLTDPRIEKILSVSTDHLNGLGDGKNNYEVAKVISATSQVVSGVSYDIKVELTTNNCEVKENSLNSCPKSKKICDINVWSQLWLQSEIVKINCDNEPEISFNAFELEKTRSKRSLGAPASISKDDPKIYEHLNQLLPKLDSQSDKHYKLKIKEIVSASKQIVAGTNWNINAKIILSNCLKCDTRNGEECVEKDDFFETFCNFKFWEKLPNEDGVRAIENVEVKCDEPALNLNKSRLKRQLAGGFFEVDVNDERISKNLNKILPKLSSTGGSSENLKISEIISAKSQVVAGTNWVITARISRGNRQKTVCTFKFWEKLPNKDGVREIENVEVKCDEPALNLNKSRLRRQLVGGYHDVDINDERITKHLNKIVPKLESNNGDASELEISEIISAKTQVVAGTNWVIKARISGKNGWKTVCTFKFWEKLPNKNGFREIENVQVKCDEPSLSLNKSRLKRQLVGGYYDVDLNDERITKHLNKILPKLESSTGVSKNWEISEVISAKSQVVAGTNWEIKARLSNRNGQKTVCTFKFWEKLPDKNGLRHFENLQVECDEQKLKLRTKRENDENDLIYEYLTKSLQHIDLNSPEEYKYKIKEIISVDKNEHLSIKTRLILSDCEKNDVTDWDQCGDLQGVEPKICLIKIRETQINITCENQKHEYSFKTKRSLKYLEEFENFMRKHEKNYRNLKELAYRFSIFEENMKLVKLLNENEQGTAFYGATEFADLTREEFKSYLGYRPDLKNENELEFSQAEIPDIQLPKSFDWRDKNVVTNVKNQGSCGSCWAFSVTGNVEGQYAIKYKKLLEFSEQELVDCDKIDEGCNGGLMDNAYRQIEKLGGLESETEYPYEAKDDRCHFNPKLVKVELSGAVNISTNETDMAKWLTQNGPISIAINANAMQFYMGGVSHPWKFLCNPKSLDHGVLIVGYGVHTYPKFKKSLPYWIVKNSWGKSWGEQGYYRVYRGDGTCGVNQTPSSAILK